MRKDLSNPLNLGDSEIVKVRIKKSTREKVEGLMTYLFTWQGHLTFDTDLVGIYKRNRLHSHLWWCTWNPQASG